MSLLPPKKCGYLLVAIYLVMQIFSVLHMAEYGFVKHQHDGKVCSIYLYCEQAQNEGNTKPITFHFFGFVVDVLLVLSLVVYQKRNYLPLLARAPPVRFS